MSPGGSRTICHDLAHAKGVESVLYIHRFCRTSHDGSSYRMHDTGYGRGGNFGTFLFLQSLGATRAKLPPSILFGAKDFVNTVQFRTLNPRNGMISYSAAGRAPKVYSTVKYGELGAIGSNPVMKRGYDTTLVYVALVRL